MTNYKETTETGSITKWSRARQMILDNPVDGAPSVMCYEQEATRYPDGSVQEKSTDSLSYALTDPTVEIPVIDPATFEPTATTFTAEQYWLMSASVYMWLARQRDGESE